VPSMEHNNLRRLLYLRSGSILTQIGLIAVAHLWLGYRLPVATLSLIIIVETIFNLLSFIRLRSTPQWNHTQLSLQIAADIIFLSLLLYFTGGATNPFVSLLLLPVAIAAVLLPIRLLIAVMLGAFLTYSALLILPSKMPVTMDMQDHYIGMWINFIMSALVVSVFVAAMARTINRRERAIAAFREEQMRQEQMLALGTASAQITHELATPIATMQLLYDELDGKAPPRKLHDDFGEQLQRCAAALQQFRQLAERVGDPATTVRPVQELLDELGELCRFGLPDAELNLEIERDLQGLKINTDSTLIPALLNLVHNAAKANQVNAAKRIDLKVSRQHQHLVICVRDYGQGIAPDLLEELGERTVESAQGLVMAIFFSNATLERLGGKLELSNLPHGAEARVYLPLIATQSTR